jgi:hypothetical protein
MKLSDKKILDPLQRIAEETAGTNLSSGRNNMIPKVINNG